ncbi:hypothetical protein ABI_09480 [Asticcacaulis biprosthecium C19]|uniref:SHOCT domain-containing protein n=1 Tax=Asticcacaulis biprosthecium C19 TaxID=715226 RepID=F4QGQ9_9CAUL|nr:SHOCT domain-containing protein [Asticcacaulis biprosthecium]EGF92511.1 hypothetical protein ABI_09480 [Asticcacaulis biprosthecium C19]
MNATASASDLVCTNPACGARNRAGTRFCASCGTAIGASAAPDQPLPTPQPSYVPPPQPPRFNPALPGMHGMPAITPDRFTDLALPAHEACDRAIAAVQSLGGDVSAQNPPLGFMAILPRRLLGSTVRFRSNVAVQAAGPSSTRVGIGIKPDWGSTLIFLGIIGGIGLFNVFFLTMSVGLLAPLLSIAGFGWAVYDIAVGIPNKLAGQFEKALTGGVATPIRPTPAPAFTPAPVPPAAPAETPASTDEADIIAKIEKLAGLRDKGLIDAAEFERRRTDLLDRL